MRLKAPQSPSELRDERELQIKTFIGAAVDAAIVSPVDDLLLVARSPESAAARAVFGLSPSLAARGMSARIILLAANPGDHWTLEFAPGFRHETRLANDPRLLDAHEQLVIGDRSLWFGDSMRREPEKRDAFMQFIDGDDETVRRARMTFARLWESARPLYRHEQTQAATPLVEVIAPGAGDAALASDVLATLNAWRPSSRH